MSTRNELDKSVVKKMELVLDRYLKRYDWFEKIELETVGYSPSERVSHFAPVGTIYVDGDWLYEKWREYYHEGPFPDLYDEELGVSLGDFIGGDFSEKLRGEFTTIFVAVTGYLRPKYVSWSWLKVRIKDDETQNLRETIKKVLRESIELDHSIRRRLNVNQQEMIDRYKKEVLRNFKYEKDLKIIIDKSSRDAAFEILDYIEAWRDLPQAKAMNELKVLSQYLHKNYGDMMMDFIRNTFDENHIGFDDFTYVFHKHSNRNGTGNGFSDGYQTWFELLKQKASWFSDLNWNEIKSKLDKQNGPASVLIKSPGDEGNMYNYYFSIRKQPRR